MAAADELVRQIPTAGYPAQPAPNPPVGGETARNVNNALNAMGGMGVVSSVPLRAPQAAQAAGRMVTPAGPALANPAAAQRLAGPTQAAADFVAGPAGVQATRTMGRLPAPQQVGQLPQAVPGLAQGAQANMRAATARAVGNANAALVQSEQQQDPPAVDVVAPRTQLTDQAGGAVFGMYPSAAGTRLSSYGTDARLRGGQLADGTPAQASAVPSAQQALPAGVAPSTAGPGRGTGGQPQFDIPSLTPPGPGKPAAPPSPGAGMVPGENAADDRMARGDEMAPQPPTARAQLTGAVKSADVAGAPGVQRLTTADGRTLYSNVEGAADNDALMSKRPGLQTVPSILNTADRPGQTGQGAATTLAASIDQQLGAARMAAVDRGDMAAVQASYGDPAAAPTLSAAPGAGAVVLPSQAVAARDDRNARFDEEVLRHRGTTAANLRPGRAGAQLASTYFGAADQLAQRRQAPQLEGQRQAGETQRANIRAGSEDRRTQVDARRAMTDASTGAARARKDNIEGDAAAMVLQAQQALRAATTPEQRQRAEEDLRALQGKYEREQPELFSSQVMQGDIGESPSLAVTNKRSGQVRMYDANGQPRGPAGTAAPALPARDKMVAGQVYQTARGAARWDGKQFVPVTQ